MGLTLDFKTSLSIINTSPINNPNAITDCEGKDENLFSITDNDDFSRKHAITTTINTTDSLQLVVGMSVCRFIYMESYFTDPTDPTLKGYTNVDLLNLGEAVHNTVRFDRTLVLFGEWESVSVTPTQDNTIFKAYVIGS